MAKEATTTPVIENEHIEDTTPTEPKATTPEPDTIIIEKHTKPKRKPKSPVEKVECLKCGISVRKYDLKRHETMYCNAPPDPPKLTLPPPVEEPAPAPKAKVKSKAKPRPKAPPPEEPAAPSYPKELSPNNENENDLIMKLLQHINTKPKDNREDRYKKMMGQFYKI